MARGQRFELNLDDDATPDDRPSLAAFSLVRDITERSTAAAEPPLPPTGPNTATGFPKFQASRRGPSRFKQQAASHPAAATHELASISNAAAEPAARAAPPATSRPHVAADPERARIDQENKEVLARMSEAEIEQERRDLLGGGVPGLTPSLIERLLRRADLRDGSHEMQDTDPPPPAAPSSSSAPPRPVPARVPRVSFADAPAPAPQLSPPPPQPSPAAAPTETAPSYTLSTSTLPPTARPAILDDAAPPHPPSALLHPAASSAPAPTPPIHFPLPAHSTATLDPAAPTFLADLHATYFPHLAANPDSLAWMQPLPSDAAPDPAGAAADYSPAHDAVPPSALRFDFRGRLLPPGRAAALPTTLGLHHHGAAPAAAGYTLGELARLQRSAVAAQRCIAHQTLGRILYRLGRGAWGPDGTEVAEGLWTVVARERIVESLLAEAGRGERGQVATGKEEMEGKDEKEEKEDEDEKAEQEGRQGETQREGGKGKTEQEDKGRSDGRGDEMPGAALGPRAGSRTAWALATEAVWLWQRGGGRGGAEWRTR